MMRAASSAAGFGRKPPDKKSRTPVRLAVLLLCCLLLTACPSTGGDLRPVLEASGGGGDQLESVSFKNDTLGVTHDQVTVKGRGNWSASDSNTSLTVEIGNRSATPVTVAFDNCEMVNNDSREKLSLRSLAEYREGNAPAFINERSVTIEGGQTKKFQIDFFIKAADGRSSVSRDVEGQTVTFRVPITVRTETSAPVDFLFAFKYVEYQH